MVQSLDPCLGPSSTEDAASICEARVCAVTHNEGESCDSDTRVNIFTLKPANGRLEPESHQTHTSSCHDK